jgi:hypothetical protein
MTQRKWRSARIRRDSRLLPPNTFGITSFADPSVQLPWNDILAKKHRGVGVASQTLSTRSRRMVD